MSQNIHLFLGASSAVARNMADIYAGRGEHLILAGRDIEDLSRTASHLNIKYKVEVTALQFDSCDWDAHLGLIQKIKQLADGYTLNIIALSAIMPDQKEMEQDTKLALSCIQTGYSGLISLINPLAAYMEEQERGSMIFFGSVAGDRGRLNNYLYGSVKAALACYASGLRNRLGRKNIHVMTVKPGFIDTKMIKGMKLPPLPIAKPKDVARHVVKAHDKKRNILYTPHFWLYIMMIIKLIPEFIFKKLKI